MDNDLLFLVWLNSFDQLGFIFEFVSGRVFSFCLLGIIGIYFTYIRKIRLFLFILLSIIIGDQIGAFLKDLIQEPRPCFEHAIQLIDVGVINERCGSRLTGMPSNHALNFFLFSTLVFSFTKKKLLGFCLFCISSVVGLSRVFLVKHLLSQVIMGAALGIFLGVIFYKLSRKIQWIEK